MMEDNLDMKEEDLRRSNLRIYSTHQINLRDSLPCVPPSVDKWGQRKYRKNPENSVKNYSRLQVQLLFPGLPRFESTDP